MVDLSAIKRKIDENRAVLMSITDASDLLLTELIGEGVLEESTKEDILAGKTRIECNRRLFQWLCDSNNPLVFEKFLKKLREFGQSHIANLLDETPGELPLNAAVRQPLQKIMRDLTQNIDLDSGLLESLLSSNIISEIDYQELKTEQTPKLIRAKRLWDVLLRGSDRTFEKFKEEILKTQPEMFKLIEQQEGVKNKRHVALLKKHRDILSRCTDINLLTIAFLESKDVIDKSMADSMKSTDEPIKRFNQLFNLLMFKPSEDAFHSFVEVMQENEQRHVANLLTKNLSGQQPLSEDDYKALVKKKPYLIIGIKPTTDLVAAMRSAQEQERGDTDFAISQIDNEVITEKYTIQSDKTSALVDAVLRRTEFSLKALEGALNETKQGHMADYLKEGIAILADVKTTRIDKEEPISNLCNEFIAKQQSPETRSDEEQQFADHYERLNDLGIPMVAADASGSILILTYCKRPEDARKYVRLLKSGYLQTIYEKIFNLLLRIIEPDDHQPLEAAIILEDSEKETIREFAGLDESLTVEDDPVDVKSCCSLHGNPLNSYCCDCKKLICCSCVEQEHRSHKHSDVNMSAVKIREKLEKDLQLISSCRSTSIKVKEAIELEQKGFLRRIEESEIAVRNRCEDLKVKVENFRHMVLENYATGKEQALNMMAESKRDLDSYLTVVGDYEQRVRHLMDKGTPIDICGSFSALHERAEKLQRCTEQPPSSAVEAVGALHLNLPLLVPKLEEDCSYAEITKKLVQSQKDFLYEYMNPESGLLDHLVVSRALSEETAAEIRKLSSYHAKNRELLETLIKEGKCKELGFALAASKQGHLVNYLESQGTYDSKFGQNWPVTDRERAHLDLLRDKLHFLFGPPELITCLQLLDVINMRHKNQIFSQPSLEAKCDALLEILKRGSISDFCKTEDLLAMCPDKARPHLKPLEKHRKVLEDCLDPYSELVEDLNPVLSKKDIELVKSEHSLKRNMKLLDIISATKNDNAFIEALTKSGQMHIVNYLNQDGVYDPKFEGEWPVVCSNEWIKLQANRKLIVDKLKLLDLLEDLQLKQVISSKQKNVLLQTQLRRDKNEAFLDMLGRGSVNKYRKAVEYFYASNQIEIAQLLDLHLQTVVQTLQVQLLQKERVELCSAFREVLAF